MAPPASFGRNGQRISILNPMPHQPIDDGDTDIDTDSASPPADSPSPPPRGVTRKLHQCHVCLKTFTTSGHLTRHSRIHTGIKPHVCPYPGCDKDCSRLDNLIQHYRVHLPKEDRSRGNPYIRASMLDLPADVDMDVPENQQPRTPIVQDDLALAGLAANSKPRRPRKHWRTASSFSDIRSSPTASPTSPTTATLFRPPVRDNRYAQSSPNVNSHPPASPQEASSSGAPTPIMTPTDEVVYPFSPTPWARPGTVHKESFMRGNGRDE